jgi:ectoine utilization protein EutC
MDVVVLDEATLRARVTISREAMTVVEAAFAALGRGGVVMPPVLHLDLPERHAEMDVKTAYVPGLPSMALKVSTGFFDNPKRGLPSLSGMMTLISAETGRVEAVLLDNGYLTDVRTALAGGIAADRLARADARVAGIIGTGLQARLQLEALRLVRRVERVLVWGRDPAKAQGLARGLEADLGLPVAAVPIERAVREADIVVTTTAAREPLLMAEWLHPGLHITAMGSDAPGKQELDPAILGRADRIVVDRRSQCERLGELRGALAAGTVRPDQPIDELGEIVAGSKPGRRSAEEITVCDLTGTGAQDTAIAVHAARAAA